MKITYDEMPPSAQKSYRLTNNIRRVTMKVSWGVSVLLFIVFMIISDDNILECLMSGIFLGCFLHGQVHSLIIARSLFRKLKNYGLLGILIGLHLGVVVTIALGGYGGPIFNAIDTILFIKKKPLIYRWEHKYFLESQAAQQEMQAVALGELVNAVKSQNPADRLRDLNALKEQGAITQEEYDAKKEELLREI